MEAILGMASRPPYLGQPKFGSLFFFLLPASCKSKVESNAMRRQTFGDLLLPYKLYALLKYHEGHPPNFFFFFSGSPSQFFFS
jgi:hypothetical protein